MKHLPHVLHVKVWVVVITAHVHNNLDQRVHQPDRVWPSSASGLSVSSGGGLSSRGVFSVRNALHRLQGRPYPSYVLHVLGRHQLAAHVEWGQPLVGNRSLQRDVNRSRSLVLHVADRRVDDVEVLVEPEFLDVFGPPGDSLCIRHPEQPVPERHLVFDRVAERALCCLEISLNGHRNDVVFTQHLGLVGYH